MVIKQTSTKHSEITGPQQLVVTILRTSLHDKLLFHCSISALITSKVESFYV